MTAHVAATRRLAWKMARAECERLSVHVRRIRAQSTEGTTARARLGLHRIASDAFAQSLAEACE